MSANEIITVAGTRRPTRQTVAPKKKAGELLELPKRAMRPRAPSKLR